eukprot:6541982-Prymnesium_polylepis.1
MVPNTATPPPGRPTADRRTGNAAAIPSVVTRKPFRALIVKPNDEMMNLQATVRCTNTGSRRQ